MKPVSPGVMSEAAVAARRYDDAARLADDLIERSQTA